MRVESANPCPSGGWFHFLKERPKRVEVRRGPKPPVRPRMFNAELTMAGFRAEFESPGGGKDIFDSLIEVANDLNLCAADIDRLLVGRSAFHGAWAFPMLDGGGKCVGIRLREYGGSGIGLSIVKAVMEGMNQEYGVKNYENGVEFWFTLDIK
jgi:hypothetical protein